jgi:hypothetical protein
MSKNVRTASQLAVLWLISSAAASSGDTSRNYTDHASRLFDDLFGDDSTYNLHVPPFKDERDTWGDLTQAGTDVAVNLRVFKVVEVVPNEAHMALKVWVRMNWKDERLKWNPDDYGGTTFLSVPCGNPELQVIWKPDLSITNSRVPNGETLEEVAAMVYSDGSVFWSRPGTIDVLCQFTGLVAFPFDQLGCQIEMMGWTWSGHHQGIVLSDGGADLTKQERSSRVSYQELSLESVNATLMTYYYPCCPSEPWPAVRWTFILNRATSYYVNFYMWPAVLVTFLSFGAFFMSPDVGERLGYGITLVLTVEVGKAVFHEMLPVCGEMLWIEMFNTIALIFCYFSLMETIVVLYLAHHDEDTVLPAWLIVSLRQIGCMEAEEDEADESADGDTMTDEQLQAESSAALLFRVFNDSVLHDPTQDQLQKPLYGGQVRNFNANRPPERQGRRRSTLGLGPVHSPPASPPANQPSPGNDRPSVAQADWLRRYESDARVYDSRPETPVAVPSEMSESSRRRRHRKADNSASRNTNNFVRDGFGLLRPTKKLDIADAARLVFFEKLFFVIDVESKGGLTIKETSRALSFLAFDIPPAERIRIMKSADVNGDGELQRWEWVELCVAVLWTYPIDQLEMAASNFVSAQAAKQEANQLKWKALGKKIDQICRFWVVVSYVLVLGLLFNVQFHDPYAWPGFVSKSEALQREIPSIYDGTFMFRGIWELSMSAGGSGSPWWHPSSFV